jgi:YtcA-like protein
VKLRKPLLIFVCLLCAACSRAPSINVLGSFFPAWMVCIIAAVVLAFVVRFLLLKFKLESEVGNLGLFYPCVVIFLACGLWLLFFR